MGSRYERNPFEPEEEEVNPFSELKRREEAAARGNIFNVSVCRPGILPTIDVFSDHVLVGIFYIIGFAFFCLESLLSIWVIQQVYMYFRGSGKAADMKREAARGAMRAAI